MWMNFASISKHSLLKIQTAEPFMESGKILGTNWTIGNNETWHTVGISDTLSESF